MGLFTKTLYHAFQSLNKNPFTAFEGTRGLVVIKGIKHEDKPRWP
jgi:hypothetical protein